MPTHRIRRGATLLPGETGQAQSSPIYLDSDTGTIKVVPGATGTTEKEIVDASTAQTLTNKTLTSPVITNPTTSGQTPATITAATATLGAAHVGRVTTLDRAGGIAITLPAATGSGDKYELIIKTTFTGAASIAVADGTDYMIGVAQLGIDGGTAVPHQYPTANTGTLATESDTCSLFGAANSQGGFKGGRIVLVDVATDIWHILYTSDAGGTEATPFSAAV